MLLNEPFRSIAAAKRNSRLLPLYAAVAAKIRKSMDDWIPFDAAMDFRAVMTGLNLTVVEDCIFENIIGPRSIPGHEKNPTTCARAVSLENGPDKQDRATIHVFISAHKDWAEAAYRVGWYPLQITGGRILPRPRVDAERLGRAFGYPECCTKAFFALNDWSIRNHLAIALRSKTMLPAELNCLMKHTPYVTIFHTPCTASCRDSFEMSRAVLEAVRAWDETYARRIHDHLRGTFLVINEALAGRLIGMREAAGGQLLFDNIEFVTPPYDNKHGQMNWLRRLLSTAKSIEIKDRTIIFPDTGYTHSPCITAEWFEDPFVVTFA